MTVLSILACKILQDELVWILKNDAEVNKVVIIESENISEFTEKLDEQHISYEILPLENVSRALEDTDGNELVMVINIRELALHLIPKKLKDEVYQNIREMTPFSNGMLLFYGLCGNVLGNVEEDFSLEEDGCVVRILRDDEKVVDDCIGATVGGWANYLKLLKDNSKEPAFYFTPMYANSWREFKVSGIDYDTDPEKALKMDKMINDMAGYSRVAKVNTGLTYVKDFDEKIKEFAELFGYTTFEVDGSPELFKKCYLSIKDELNIGQ